MGQRTVGDAMTRTVIAIGPDAPFKEIVKILDQWGISALPVLEGEGRVVGVVSEADLLPKEEFRGQIPSMAEQTQAMGDLAKAGALTAWELMTSPAVTVQADATLAEAARIMVLRHVKRLPVVTADGRLEGVISRSDLLKVFLRQDEEIAAEVRSAVIGQLFPRDGQDITVTVDEGVVTLVGTVADTSLVPAVARAVWAVEGVVGVDMQLRGARHALS